MRLLLIDEDRTFGRVLVKHMADEGHAVDWVQNEQGVDPKLLRQGYDCLLIGINLPEDHSETRLKSLRTLLAHSSSLVITSRRVLSARVALLDMGADDIVVKPVDLLEVSARIRAITRRGPKVAVSDSEIRYGPLTLDSSKRSARWKDEVVSLTKKEFWVLEILVRHRNQILSRSRLEERLYGWRDEIESNAVEVYIHQLRRKFDPRLILTFRGLGYKLGPSESLPA